MSKSAHFYVEGEPDYFRWFTRVPNLVDDLGLSVYAHRLYCRLRRVAGESGTCYQSTRTLAKACRMSMGSVSNAKAELIAAELIVCKQEMRHGGMADVIRVVNIWKRNYDTYAATCSPDEQACSPTERTRSSGETKNNTLRKTQEERKASSSFNNNRRTNRTVVVAGAKNELLSRLVSLQIEDPTRTKLAEQLATVDSAALAHAFDRLAGEKMLRDEGHPSVAGIKNWAGYAVSVLRELPGVTR